ncbi:MAG TPA: RHS repeat-associated core domain-containing protein [Stellaceae bacterium]|nr:RHS repeat-associated core domain-containing protein [Stellaceae bacterium]
MRRHGKHLAALAAALPALLGAGSADATTSLTRTSSFAYDPASGLLTQEVIEPNTPSLSLATAYTYDAYGNKLQATVSGSGVTTRSTSSSYDGLGQFAIGASNALGQSESWAYDPRFGTPTSHTGPNGLTTTWTYDAFGRKTLETRADGTQTAYAYLYCSGVNGGTASCPANGAYLVQATPLASDGVTQNGPQSTAYYDALDRVIAQDTQVFDGSLSRVATQYDALGRVQQKSRPNFVSGGTPENTVYSRDALGRVVTATYPDGSTTTRAYHGLTISATNALGQTRTTVKNDQGLVASVTDAAGQVTAYVYDPFGEPIQTTDPAGNVTTYTYDTRGRKVAMNDPDMGSWSYAYDVLSELVSQTDAKGQTSLYQYDLLGRLVQRTEPDMTSNWVYDTAPGKGIGKLASASVTAGPSNGYQRSYTYDSLGRPIQAAFTVGGSSYTVATAYDSASRISAATYPSGFQAQYSYTSLGYLSQLGNASTGQAYWTANARDAELHLTQQTAGNGVSTSQSFDPATGRLLGIHAVTPSEGEVENLAFSYDALGNLTERQDLDQGLAESLTYDSLDRLTQATITGSPANPPVKTFAYDMLGDITAKPEAGTYTYPAPGQPRPHAVTSISGGTVTIASTFGYDANGNQTAGMGRTIGYTSFNLPNSIGLGTTNVSFTHDTEHQRLTKTDTNAGATVTTLYIAAGPVYAELVTGGGGTSVTWNEYLMADGAMVGVRFNTISNPLNPVVTTRYFHKDHLGSVAVLTDENANVVQRLSYDAWGRQRNPATWADDATGILPEQDQTTRGFTGQEQLADVGLVHMNGRVYDPTLGRFTSADPVVQDPYNAQSLNRYSYVYDNPLAYSDPSGHCFLGLCHLFSAIANIVSSIISHPQVILAIAVAVVFVQPAVIGLVGSALSLSGAAATIASAAIGGAIAGGIATGSLEGALVGAFTAGVLAGIGDITQNWALPNGPQGSIDWEGAAESAGVHAFAGGVTSVAAGHDFTSGFLAAGVSDFAGPEITKLDLGTVGEGVARVTIGGTAAAVGGGSFANGAVTAAYEYLFNAYQHQSYGPPGQYTADQLQGTIYNETSSLSGDGIYDARVDIGYVAENRIQAGIYGGLEDSNLSAQEQAAIQNGVPAAVDAFSQSGAAAQQVLQNPGGDPTGGAKYFFMGGSQLPSTFQGQPLLMQLGPFRNSVPSDRIPNPAFIGIYGRGPNSQ